MPIKRLRIFAGPNGSGKSFLKKNIPSTIPIGYYINADDIESRILSAKGIKLNKYGIQTTNAEFQEFIRNSSYARHKSNIPTLLKFLHLENNTIKITENGSAKYAAAIITDFIREINLKAGNDFSFETVMSHPEKIKFIKKANKLGYHVYLYYICTDSPEINIFRVQQRVAQGGHNVPEIKIKKRYFRSLNLLYPALKQCYKSYLIDSTEINSVKIIAQINRDKIITISGKPEEIPSWVIKYVFNKIWSRQ